MKFREGKPNDQEMAEKAYQLLLDFISEKQREIEPAIWVGAMIAALATNYEDSDIPFKLFKDSMLKAIEHYKY